jgi:hypothetical protein
MMCRRFLSLINTIRRNVYHPPFRDKDNNLMSTEKQSINLIQPWFFSRGLQIDSPTRPLHQKDKDQGL